MKRRKPYLCTSKFVSLTKHLNVVTDKVFIYSLLYKAGRGMSVTFQAMRQRSALRVQTTETLSSETLRVLNGGECCQHSLMKIVSLQISNPPTHPPSINKCNHLLLSSSPLAGYKTITCLCCSYVLMSRIEGMTMQVRNPFSPCILFIPFLKSIQPFPSLPFSSLLFPTPI